ncbi:SecY/SEC61-alpha family [Gossypium australe]|uniref:SecY/SEC61-alpha family n=1 Tax=Gossypium australe TaxID=47621 RepID=A0A5B6W716_9ROSI|nr:SecY/SEC61-alpha family [Gossypium australe]
MVTFSEWRRSTYARKPAGLDMMEVINSSQFWKKAVDVLKIQELLVKVLRMCDGDEKPTMGFIYEAMDRAKLLRHVRRKSVQELEMSFNPINLDNTFEEDDPLNAWIEEREDATLDSEHNFSWLPQELLNETDEETQCEDMNDISLAPSNGESVQLSTLSGDDGDDPDGNNECAYQTTHGHIYSSNFHGDQGVTRYPYAADPGLYETNASISLQNRRDRGDRTHERMREHLHDSFAVSSSPNLLFPFAEIFYGIVGDRISQRRLIDLSHRTIVRNGNFIVQGQRRVVL